MRRRFKSLIGSLHRDSSRSRLDDDHHHRDNVVNTAAVFGTTVSAGNIDGCVDSNRPPHDFNATEEININASRSKPPSNNVKGLQSQRVGRRVQRVPTTSPVLTCVADTTSPEEIPAEEKIRVPAIPRMPSNVGRCALTKDETDITQPSIKRLKLNNGGYMYRDIEKDEFFTIPLPCMSSRTRDTKLDPSATPTSCPEAEEACASQRNFASHGVDFVYFLESLRNIKENNIDNANIALLRWAVLRKIRSLAKLQSPAFCHQSFVRVSGRLSPRIRYNEAVTADSSFAEKLRYYDAPSGALQASETDTSKVLILLDKCCGKVVYRQGDPHRGRPPQYSYVTANVSHRSCTTLEAALSSSNSEAVNASSANASSVNASSVNASSSIKFENINMSFALSRPTCDMSLNRKAAAATPKAFQLGGPLANTLLASEWQSAAETQSLMLSQFIRTMLCGESSRFIHMKSPSEYQVWDIVLEDFKIQMSNFTHLFSIPSISGCQDGSELLAHSLIKLPFYAVRWESMPDHSQTPCHLLQSSTRLNIQGTISVGWSSAALACPAELKLNDVTLDQLPEFLSWAIYHCPEQVPCKVWVNDPHSGLVVSTISLPVETQQSHFLIDNFRYSVVRGSSSPSLSFDMLANFIASSYDTYQALFHVVMETAWQLLRSDDHRMALISMISDPERRSLLKNSCRDLSVIRTHLDMGIPFGQGWTLTSSSSTLPPTSLSIQQLSNIVKQLLRTLTEKDSPMIDPMFDSEIRAALTAECIHSMTWSGDSFLYLGSHLRPRPTNKNIFEWGRARRSHHIVDASNAAALRAITISPYILSSLGSPTKVEEISGRPIHLSAWTETQTKETFAAELRWFNYPLALDATHSTQCYHDVSIFLAQSHHPEEAFLYAHPPLFFSSFSIPGTEKIHFVRELLQRMTPTQSDGTANSKVVRYLVERLPRLSTVAQRLLLPPKPSLCMAASGELLAAFRVVFVPPDASELSNKIKNEVLNGLQAKLMGFLSDHSRATLMHELRSFAASKPLCSGVGLLFFRVSSTTLRAPHTWPFGRSIITPSITPSKLDTPCLLNRWEASLNHEGGQNELWSTLTVLLSVYEEFDYATHTALTSDEHVLRALPLAVFQESGGFIHHADDWDRALVEDALLNTTGALIATMLANSIASFTSETAPLFLKGLPHNSFSGKSLAHVEGLITESLFMRYTDTENPYSGPVTHFNDMIARVLVLLQMKPRSLGHCVCALTGVLITAESVYLPYRPTLFGPYDTLTSEGMSAVSKIVGQIDSLPTLRLMIYEGETPALRNLVKKAVCSVDYLWNGIAICTAVRQSLFKILYKAFAILGSILKTPSAELFRKGSSLYEHWHVALTLLQKIKWLHCLVLKCPNNSESAICNLLCSVAWMILSLLLGRFTSAVRWSEYAFIAASSIKAPNVNSKRLKTALDQISSYAIVQLTSAAYFLNDPDLTVVFGTLARSLRESLINPTDASDVCSDHFSFQIGPPELPPTTMKMLARIPCRKRVYTLISELDGDGSRQNLFEMLDKCYVPYDVRTLLALEERGVYKDLSPIERVEIENCESASVLLHHLACTSTFRRINLSSEEQNLAFGFSALEVLEDGVRKLDGAIVYSEAPRMTAEDSKSIRRAMKAEYTRILRSTTLWTRGNNGLAASLGIGRPKCFRYEHALASTDPKFALENESIKSKGEDLWWCTEPLPCVGVTTQICDIASGEYHTVCLTSDRKRLIVIGSTRSGQLGFTLDTYRKALRSTLTSSEAKHPLREAFRKSRRTIRDNYMEQFVFHDLKLGVVSQMSSNYADIKYHLPWSIARPLAISFYPSSDSQNPMTIRLIGTGASYTALIPDDASQVLIFGHMADSLDETSSTGSTEYSRSQSMCRAHNFPSPPAKMSCGPFHIAVITDDHRLFVWGKGDAGQLGLPMYGRAYYDTPREMIVHRFVSKDKVPNSQASKNVGRLFTEFSGCVGDEILSRLYQYGQLYWSQESQNLIILVDEGHLDDTLLSVFDSLAQQEQLQQMEFLDIACGEAHNIAIARWKNDHYRFLVSWGQNEYGQLGNSNLQFLYTPQDGADHGLENLMNRYEAAMGDLAQNRQVAKPYLDFINLRDETIEPLSVYAGGTSSGCLINLDSRSLFLWGNNDRGCLTRPEDHEPWISHPIEIRFDQDISKVYLCLGDPFTVVRFTDGSVKTYGMLSGLGGNMTNGSWHVPRTFEFSSIKNWLTASRLSEKQADYIQKQGRELYDTATPKDASLHVNGNDASGRVRIPFAVHDMALGSAHSAFVVDTQKDLMENLPRVVVRRSCLLKTARSVQRDSATSTRTSTASEERNNRVDQVNELYDLIEQGPDSKEETMNKILVDLKRPWDPPLPHDLKAWAREGDVKQSPHGSRLNSPPRNNFLEQVGTSGLQGLTHLSQLLVTNVVQKGIENMDDWMDRQSRRDIALQSPTTGAAKLKERPRSTLTTSHDRRHMTPSEGSPRLKPRHERVPTHRSLEASLQREKAYRNPLPDFGEGMVAPDNHVSHEAWEELNMKLAARSPPKVSEILTQVPPRPASSRGSPYRLPTLPSTGASLMPAGTDNESASVRISQQHSPSKALRTAADRASSRSGSDRTGSIQAGSNVYVPRQYVRPQSAQTGGPNLYRPPPLAPMWHLSRPMYSHPMHTSAINRSATGPRLSTAQEREAMMHPARDPFRSRPQQRPRVLDFDGQGYITLPPSSTNSPDSMVYNG